MHCVGSQIHCMTRFQEVVVPEPLSPAAILELARGFMSSKVLLAAAKLRLFDALRDGPLTGRPGS